MNMRTDPYGGFNFQVAIDSITRAFFQECSGLDSTIDVVEYREGGKNNTVRKLPGVTKFSNITLKWGVTDDHELYDWHRQWSNGDPKAQRKTVVVNLLDRQGDRKVSWKITDAWPIKWTGPSFNSQSSEVAVETLELAHEGIELEP